MAYVKTNPNPLKKNVGDCTVRAISLATGKEWNETYVDLCLQGFQMADMPSSNSVWGEYLIENGFSYHVLPDTCPYCYTVRDFARDHKTGVYVLGTGTHVIAVIDGFYMDAWDSGDKTPLFYFSKEV